MSELELRAPKAAAEICRVLNEKNVDYAIGGALALAYWCEPRATIDVDITVYLPLDQPGQTIELLIELDCDFSHVKVTEQLREYGFCRATFRHTVVDFFLPTLSLYELAKERRRQVLMEGVTVFVWEPEVLCIFKMMFMRTQDFADIENCGRPSLKRSTQHGFASNSSTSSASATHGSRTGMKSFRELGDELRRSVWYTLTPAHQPDSPCLPVLLETACVVRFH
ncbi:MAG: hypothetical protein KDA52_09805 [Planctomycetaceae bacterium]|nr:hypothetical protein [Planctomycetaceae bacterium]